MTLSSIGQLVIAAPEAVAGKVDGILARAGISARAVVHSGEEAVAACAQRPVIVLTTYRLADMTGEELAEKLGEDADVLMIVPQDYEQETPENVMPLHNPIGQDALVQAVRTTAHCQARMEALRAQAQKLARTLEERKVIDRAKGRLMDTLHMSEKDAHHFIQKKSMDSGRRIVDVAREILDAEALSAS